MLAIAILSTIRWSKMESKDLSATSSVWRRSTRQARPFRAGVRGRQLRDSSHTAGMAGRCRMGWHGHFPVGWERANHRALGRTTESSYRIRQLELDVLVCVAPLHYKAIMFKIEHHHITL